MNQSGPVSTKIDLISQTISMGDDGFDNAFFKSSVM